MGRIDSEGWVRFDSSHHDGARHNELPQLVNASTVFASDSHCDRIHVDRTEINND
jgi:hypothetical protein